MVNGSDPRRGERTCKGCGERFATVAMHKVMGNKAAGGSVGTGHYCPPCERTAFMLLGVS